MLSIPGFTAEQTLYRSTQQYHRTGGFQRGGLVPTVNPQLISICNQQGGCIEVRTFGEAIFYGAAIVGSVGGGSLIGAAIGAAVGWLACLLDSDCG